MNDDKIKAAAVLIPLICKGSVSQKYENAFKLRSNQEVWIPKNTQILLTQRTDFVGHHKGQISFPGGTKETQDQSLLETALRETEEEIGLHRSRVNIVAEIPDISTVVTGFRVRSYIGLVESPEGAFSPELLRLHLNPHEIEKIFLVPLEHLLNPKNQTEETYQMRGLTYKLQAYHYETHKIWGATARMIEAFLNLLNPH